MGEVKAWFTAGEYRERPIKQQLDKIIHKSLLVQVQSKDGRVPLQQRNYRENTKRKAIVTLAGMIGIFQTTVFREFWQF